MFYDKYIALCKNKGVSRTKACVDCGISRTAWHKWESGATPNGTTIEKFSSYFGVPVDCLLGSETKKAPTPEGGRTAEGVLSKPVDKTLEALLACYNQLNFEGQEKLFGYASDLVASGRYLGKPRQETAG